MTESIAVLEQHAKLIDAAARRIEERVLAAAQPAPGEEAADGDAAAAKAVA